MSIYARRRLVVLFVIAGAFLAGGKALDALGGGPLTAAGDRSPGTVRIVAEPVSKATDVVQAGDTLWSIARKAQPSGDIRPLVDRLAASLHGRALQPGDRIALP